MGLLVKGENVVIKEGCHIGNNVYIEDNVYIDYNCIIRDNVRIKSFSRIGANCILGESQTDFSKCVQESSSNVLEIGSNSIIRSGCKIYEGVTIGKHFQTGHNVTIRENTIIGDYCSIGTLSDIQGDCKLGDYVRCHSNVHIGKQSFISDFVWIFPYVVLTNDPTPPSEQLLGVKIDPFAVVSTGAIILPGIHIETDTLIAAGAIVTKNVLKGEVVGGNPAKVISTIDKIIDRNNGRNIYPWRYSFERGMPWKDMGFDAWYSLNKDKYMFD